MQEPAERPDDEAEPPSLKLARARGSRNLKEFIRARRRILTVGGTLALGVIFVMLGWYGAANTNIITEQIPYLISGGLLGLGLIIVSAVMAYSMAMERASEELRREIARALSGGTRPEPAVAVAVAVADSAVLTVPGGKSYHVPGCPIVEGKDGVRELLPSQAMASGLAACKLCSAD